MTHPSEELISHQTFENILVVSILAETMRDQEVVNRIRDSMSAVVGQANCNSLIIDVDHVQFIGSIGFLAFLAMRRIPGVQSIVLCNLQPNVRELFLLCRLIPHSNEESAPFNEATTLPSALEWCRSLNH